MNLTRLSIDTCIVLHQPQQALRMLRQIASIGRMLNSPVRAALVLTASGGADPQKACADCLRVGIEVAMCERFDDTFLDFSGYKIAADYFLNEGSRGVVFINDTLAQKHDSKYLRAAFASAVARANANDLGFPVLVGPYRHSEFAFGTGDSDEFVSSFLFYVNQQGLRVFDSLVQTMPSVFGALCQTVGSKSQAHESLLLRFCRLHALQLTQRFEKDPEGQRRLAQKLTTACIERELSRQVKKDGVIWYVGGGMIGRLLVPLQSKLSVFFRVRC